MQHAEQVARGCGWTGWASPGRTAAVPGFPIVAGGAAWPGCTCPARRAIPPRPATNCHKRAELAEPLPGELQCLGLAAQAVEQRDGLDIDPAIQLSFVLATLQALEQIGQGLVRAAQPHKLLAEVIQYGGVVGATAYSTRHSRRLRVAFCAKVPDRHNPRDRCECPASRPRSPTLQAGQHLFVHAILPLVTRGSARNSRG